MDERHKSRETLLQELRELQQKYDSLKSTHNKAEKALESDNPTIFRFKFKDF